MSKKLAALVGFAAALLPLTASAHEVYVLTPQEIAAATAAPAFNMWAVFLSNQYQFYFWALIAAITVFIVFGVSLVRPLERLIDPLIGRGRRFAPAIARITVGVSFIAAAYYQATYGPELPLAPTYGALAPLITALLLAMGACIILGIWTRIAALAALLLFAFSAYVHGSYMLTYTNYLGEILVLLLIGAHHGSVEGPVSRLKIRNAFDALARRLAPYSFAIIRVAFGISLLYASVYAKVIHNNLALDVATLPLAGHSGSIAQAFGLEPHFLVLGAAIVEAVVATFFMLGIEIRFTSIFLEFWLSLSLWYFGETVWPHVILIGIPLAFILYGYDKYSIEGYFFRKQPLEPWL